MGEDDQELERNWDQSHRYEGELQVCGFHTESLLIPNSKIPAIARDICGAASLFVSGWSVQTCPDICAPEKAVKMVLLLGQAGCLPPLHPWAQQWRSKSLIQRLHCNGSRGWSQTR